MWRRWVASFHHHGDGWQIVLLGCLEWSHRGPGRGGGGEGEEEEEEKDKGHVDIDEAYGMADAFEAPLRRTHV